MIRLNTRTLFGIAIIGAVMSLIAGIIWYQDGYDKYHDAYKQNGWEWQTAWWWIRIVLVPCLIIGVASLTFVLKVSWTLEFLSFIIILLTIMGIVFAGLAPNIGHSKQMDSSDAFYVVFLLGYAVTFFASGAILVFMIQNQVRVRKAEGTKKDNDDEFINNQDVIDI